MGALRELASGFLTLETQFQYLKRDQIRRVRGAFGCILTNHPANAPLHSCQPRHYFCFPRVHGQHPPTIRSKPITFSGLGYGIRVENPVAQHDIEITTQQKIVGANKSFGYLQSPASGWLNFQMLSGIPILGRWAQQNAAGNANSTDAFRSSSELVEGDAAFQTRLFPCERQG